MKVDNVFDVVSTFPDIPFLSEIAKNLFDVTLVEEDVSEISGGVKLLESLYLNPSITNGSTRNVANKAPPG